MISLGSKEFCMLKCFEFWKCFSDEIRVFIFCDYSDIVREYEVKRVGRRGRVVFKFKFI